MHDVHVFIVSRYMASLMKHEARVLLRVLIDKTRSLTNRFFYTMVAGKGDQNNDFHGGPSKIITYTRLIRGGGL